jgi:fused signal recognition particle receptor
MPDSPEIAVLAVGVAVLVVAFLVVTILIRRRRAKAPGESAARSPRDVLRDGLASTRRGFLGNLQQAWKGGRDAEARLVALQEVLLAADVGVATTQRLLAGLQTHSRQLPDAEALRMALREEMRSALGDPDRPAPGAVPPHVIVVAGVNGVGKTTTIAKLAYRYRQQGQEVLLVAADTFRAAAAEQLERWAERVGAACVRHQAGSDPSAVAFDGMKAAVARGVDVVIVDTAGRLHVKANLMEELKKIVRVIGRQVQGAPHETLLVIDATTGQNAINQGRVFSEALPLTGIVLTKLDGTAKGGAVFAVRTELGVPISFIGIGEQLADLAPFDAEAFVDALLGGETDGGA